MRFRKLPVEVEAVQFDGRNDDEVIKFMAGNESLPYRYKNWLMIPTREGVMAAAPLDWIIKGIRGEFYPCKPDIFERTYEPVPLPEPLAPVED